MRCCQVSSLTGIPYNTTGSVLNHLTTPNIRSIVPGEEPEQVQGLGVTQNLLPLIGVRVAAGRGFTDDDAAPPPQQARAPGAAAPPAPPQLPAMILLNYVLTSA